MMDSPTQGEKLVEVIEPIKYSTKYISISGPVASQVLSGRHTEPGVRTEPQVLEYVEVIFTSDLTLSNVQKPDTDKPAPFSVHSRGRNYIRILSPAVVEALRCTVDYFPHVDLSGSTVDIFEPYEIFIFFERQLNEYRERLEKATDNGMSPLLCINLYACKHVSIVQQFVKERTQLSVDAERERHARGYATFDMLWLLYKPGSDVYYDLPNVGEYEPYVTKGVTSTGQNGATSQYTISFWNMKADFFWVGPSVVSHTEDRFAGEKKITTLQAFPCEYLHFTENLNELDTERIRNHFIERGKKWYETRRGKRWYWFEGHSTTFPRQKYVGLAMVDSLQYQVTFPEETEKLEDVAHNSTPLRICTCNRCRDLIYQHAVAPRFGGYFQINPIAVERLTDHQFFICDKTVEAFLFNLRDWKSLHISGFRDPHFDKTLFKRLVLRDQTKTMIDDLTTTYLKNNTGDYSADEEMYTRLSTVHKMVSSKKNGTSWSADFIQGKGEGLTFLLHGKPGVGKTYTAECIANLTERPLLSLTCSDIGVDPSSIEENLLKWFNLAERWGVILLIDEADIYMEERKVSDIDRNNLVAGFLRALEYFKGILFLTTNRVGAFDEAFVSRINLQIYYPEFSDEDRDKVWDAFFQKLEEDRETTMRIPPSTRDYTRMQEIRELKWNGREIRNSFQIAVALAEKQGIKDKEGRILIKSDHIKATVDMSRDFKNYLVMLHKGDLSKRAALMGNRFDSYNSPSKASEQLDKY
ncbi:hypothetical protein EV127DRAFT_187542 [Xylaria flabelliformis]|nr:hypothetical protein EV127DRAFT_187542 [Xylaria flabelliformis]